MAQTQQADRVATANQSQPRKFWMRWRVRLGYPVAIIYWLFAAPTWRSIAYGAVVAALGLIVRAAAAGYLRKDRELCFVIGPLPADQATWPYEAPFWRLDSLWQAIRGSKLVCW